MRHVAFSLFSVALSFPAVASACWEQAGERYGISPQLLYAIAKAESDLNPQAVNRSHQYRTGTIDIGLMQINSSNLRELKRLGISEGDLYDPCTNIQVGAWILSQKFSRHGVSWEGVGAYNAACSRLKADQCRKTRTDYAWRVYRRLPGMTPPAQPHARHAKRTAQVTAPAAPSPIILSVRVSP